MTTTVRREQHGAQYVHMKQDKAGFYTVGLYEVASNNRAYPIYERLTWDRNNAMANYRRYRSLMESV